MSNKFEESYRVDDTLQETVYKNKRNIIEVIEVIGEFESGSLYIPARLQKVTVTSGKVSDYRAEILASVELGKIPYLSDRGQYRFISYLDITGTIWITQRDGALFNITDEIIGTNVEPLSFWKVQAPGTVYTFLTKARDV